MDTRELSTRADHVLLGILKLDSGSYGRGALWLAGEKVLAVTAGEPDPQEVQGIRTTDVGQAYILPGAVDAHVHCYSHDGEGMLAATRAAAAGGVTTIVEMPFDVTGPVKDADRLNQKREIVAREATTDVALLGTLWPGGGWREAEALAEAGAVGYKVSLFHTDTQRFPRVDDAELLNVMAAVTAVDRTLCVHAENNEIVQELSRIEQQSNPRDPLTHVRTRPPVSESLGVLTAMEIARDRGTRLHLCHMSIRRAVQLADWWRQDGADISLETCPHYLMFTAEDMQTQHGRLKINPPLRDQANVDGLWKGLGEGLVPVLSSDHAPWPLSKKEDPEILKNASGAPGVQTVAVIPLGEALKRDADPSGLFDRTVSALTSGPAERFGFGDRKGRLAPGYDADIMVYQPDSGYAVTDEEQFSHAGWTPYAGQHPGGYVAQTYLRGRRIWDRSTAEVADARGELVTR